MKRKLISLFKCAPDIFRGFFCIYIIGTVLMLVILDKRYSYFTQNSLKISNAVLILFAVLFLLGLVSFLMIQKKRNAQLAAHGEINDRNFYLLLFLLFVVVFAAQLFLSGRISFITGWDAGMVRTNAENIVFQGATGVDSDYFSQYPNNLFLVYTLVFLLKLGKALIPSYPDVFLLIVMNLIVCVSLLLAVFSLYKMTKNKAATLVCMFMGTILIAFSPWIVIPYSDTIGMIFPIAAIFFYLFVPDQYIRWFLLVLSCLIGYCYKPTVIIILIAFALVKLGAGIRSCLERKIAVKKVLYTVLSCMLACVCAYALTAAVEAQNKTELDKNKETTMTHFLMLGLNQETNGVYSEGDNIFSKSFPDVESRQKANLKVVKERLKEMGPVGYMKLLARKNLVNYNDGMFAWGHEGEFYKEIPPAKDQAATFLRNLSYSVGVGTNYLPRATVVQVIWLFVLLCTGFCIIRRKGGNEAEDIVAIALLGVSMFLLIFECRARYLYIFSPLFMILSGCGIHKAVLLTENVFEKRKYCIENRSSHGKNIISQK